MVSLVAVRFALTVIVSMVVLVLGTAAGAALGWLLTVEHTVAPEFQAYIVIAFAVAGGLVAVAAVSWLYVSSIRAGTRATDTGVLF